MTPHVAKMSRLAPPASLLFRLRSKVGSFATRGMWALGDQAVCSAGNFLTGLMMARGLEKDPHSFGVYSLILSVLMFLNSLQSALITYPLTLEGAVASPERLRYLARRGLQFTFVIAPLLAVLLVVATARVDHLSLLPWAILAMVMWQGQETMRRTLLAKLRHREAILGDAVSFLGQAACVWLFWRWGKLSPQWAFGGIAATSALALLIQFCQIMAGRSKVAVEPQTTEPSTQSAKLDAIRWWTFGRWLLVTYLVNVGTVYLTPWVLEASRGEAVVASLYALNTLMNLTNPVLFSVAGLLVAAVASANTGSRTPLEGFRAGRRVAFKYGVMGFALVVPYYLLILAAPHFMLTLFFKSTSPYVALAGELRYLVPIYAASFLAQMTVSLLNGLGEARGSFVATLSSSLATVLIVLPLTFHLGLHGALIAGTVPMLVQLLVALWMLRRLHKKVAMKSAAAVKAMPTPEVLVAGNDEALVIVPGEAR